MKNSFIQGLNFLFPLTKLCFLYAQAYWKENTYVFFALFYFCVNLRSILPENVKIFIFMLNDGSYNKNKKCNGMKLVKWWKLILCIQWRTNAKLQFFKNLPWGPLTLCTSLYKTSTASRGTGFITSDFRDLHLLMSINIVHSAINYNTITPFINAGYL